MKVVSLNTDKSANDFINNTDIKIESITPVPNNHNGLIWAIVYKEKVIIKKKIYKFGCGSHLGTIWRSCSLELSDDEYDAAKKEFIENEMSSEPWRFRQEILGTAESAEWR